MARRRIDLDLGDVHAVGKCLRRFGYGFGVEILGDLAALLHLGGARSDLEQRDAAVGADHFEFAIPIADIGLAGFEQGGGNRLTLGEDRFDRLDQGMAHGHAGARAD